MIPRSVKVLFIMVVLLIGAAALILWRDPEHFWRDAWLPALAILGIAMHLWSPGRAGDSSG